MMGLPTPRALKAWARIMAQGLPKRRPGRPPRFGSRAWFIRNQASLDLPDSRNAGLPVSGNPVHDESSGEQPALRVFSSCISIATRNSGESCQINASEAACGTAASCLAGVFSTLLTAPDFSCARVVAPHISPADGISPIPHIVDESHPDKPQKKRAMGPVTSQQKPT